MAILHVFNNPILTLQLWILGILLGLVGRIVKGCVREVSLAQVSCIDLDLILWLAWRNDQSCIILAWCNVYLSSYIIDAPVPCIVCQNSLWSRGTCHAHRATHRAKICELSLSPTVYVC